MFQEIVIVLQEQKVGNTSRIYLFNPTKRLMLVNDR